jgi:hypothetical protein
VTKSRAGTAGGRPDPLPWTIRPASATAAKEWNAAIAAQPDLMAAERDRLRTRPLERTNPRRTHPLQGKLAAAKVGDIRLPQWQHEITGAGRIWYCPDKTARTIWITRVTFKHPRETE